MDHLSSSSSNDEEDQDNHNTTPTKGDGEEETTPSPRSVLEVLTSVHDNDNNSNSDDDGCFFPSSPLEDVKEADSDCSSSGQEVNPWGAQAKVYLTRTSSDIEVSLFHSTAANIPTSIGCVDESDELSDIGNAPAPTTTIDPWDFKYVHEVKWVQNPAPENPGFYSGPARFGKIPHGRGRLSFCNGDTYHGRFRNGLLHGKDGVYTTQNGSTYQGNYKDNMRHGHGQHTIAGVVRYAGYFENGIPNGYGRAFHADGSLQYEGVWEAGIPAHKMVPFQGDEQSVVSSGQLACDASSNASSSTVGGGPRGYSQYDPDRTPQDDLTVDSSFSDLTSVGSVGGGLLNNSNEEGSMANRSLDIVEEEEAPEVSMYATTRPAPSLTRTDSGGPLPPRSPIRKDWSSGDLKPSSLYTNNSRLLEV